MKLGVIVGRFQTPSLTEGHKSLIQTVSDECDSVLICIGVSSVRNTRKEPLPFLARKSMIEQYCALRFVEMVFDARPIAIPSVAPIKDLGNVNAWCKQLDQIIDEYVDINGKSYESIKIYGGRDSVVTYYNGKYESKTIPEILNSSATNEREKLTFIDDSKSLDGFRSPEFRSGMIFASQWRYPTGFPTADAACFNRDNEILLCRKPNRTQFQLPGGFFDPMLDKTLENTALRELSEECNIFADIIKYTGSYVVDDFRYRKEVDRIITTVFECEWIEGVPEAKDDIVEVKWFDAEYVAKNLDTLIYPAHQQIIIDVIQQHFDRF